MSNASSRISKISHRKTEEEATAPSRNVTANDKATQLDEVLRFDWLTSKYFVPFAKSKFYLPFADKNISSGKKVKKITIYSDR